MNGTEKQIKWANEIKDRKISAITSNEGKAIGTDNHLLSISGFYARKIAKTRFEEKDFVKSEIDRIKSLVSYDAMRSHIVSRLEMQENATWWIENQYTDVCSQFGEEYIASL